MKYNVFCDAILSLDEKLSWDFENYCYREPSRTCLNTFASLVMRFVYLGKPITFRYRKKKRKIEHTYMSPYDFHNTVYDKETMFSPYANLHKQFLKQKEVQVFLDTIKDEYYKKYSEKTKNVKSLGSEEHARESIYRYIMTILLKKPQLYSNKAHGVGKYILYFDDEYVEKPNKHKDENSKKAMEFLFSKKRDVPDHRTIGPRKTNNYD